MRVCRLHVRVIVRVAKSGGWGILPRRGLGDCRMDQTGPGVTCGETGSPPGPQEMAGTGERRRCDVSAAARAAGLCVDEGAPGAQLLRFGKGLNSDELRLMELPHEVLGALQEGERVVIRGEQGENAVLCTEGATYDLRTADTSNALLLLPSLCYTQDNCGSEDTLPIKKVTMCLSSYLELRPCCARTEKLRQLLSECPYRGPEYEEDEGEGEGEGKGKEEGEDDMADWEGKRKVKRRKTNPDRPRKYTFSDLLEVVQASERELRDALHKLQACLISGYWRLLEADYAEQAVQHILALLEEQDWHWTRVPLSSTIHLLQELLPRFVIKHCLECYSTKFNSEDDSGDTYYELSVEKVCQFYAVLLLRQAGKFNYSEFMESWQQSVPLGMETDLSQLRTLALRDMAAMPPVIWYFPLSGLPQDPAERFNCLFSARQRWTQDDIEPYIQDLATPTQSLSALLLKYARVSTVKGVKMYNAKRTLSLK